MEALDFVKLHNLYSHFSSIVETAYPLIRSHFYGDDQDEDSFFDLDFISLPPPSETGKSPDEKILTVHSSQNELGFSQRNLLLSQSDLISKRKILPIELSSKPESPVSVSILKSAPRLSISLFKKPKLMAKQKIDETDSPSHKLQSTESKRFAFKLNRVNSSRNNNRIDATERQSKREGMQKYLKLIKPLYVKVSRKQNYRSSPASSPSTTTTTATSIDEKQRNIAIGIRVVCKRLGKSKSSSSSSSATGMAVSPTNRRDDSLLQQDDGIESAILHCKRSFSATRGKIQNQKKKKKLSTIFYS
uniref:Membrane-associated kinase regulator 5 n=1 Tax=Cucumis melo TaxID=3656 RepID=A0A9I9CQ85_CUCME